MNIPVVCAAGNSGDGGVNYPAAFDETIAVAAYDRWGKIANFSSKGEKVEWAAPGVNIYSTFLNNGYASLSGTSMACPFITGVICLMLAKHKKQEAETGKNDCKTIAEIREHLLKYTKDKGEVGKDNSWGYGVIDVEKLIGGGEEPPVEEPVEEEPPVEEPVEEEPPVEEPKKKNTLFIVLGVVVVATIIGIALVMNNKVDIPTPPYFDENGEIDWDEKFKFDKGNR